MSRHGGSLGAVERVEETGEGSGVSREIVYPAKVPNHFAHHIGLAGVVPFVEEVIVDADGEQHIPMFTVFLLQGALDFANDGWTFERLLGAKWCQEPFPPPPENGCAKGTLDCGGSTPPWSPSSG